MHVGGGGGGGRHYPLVFEVERESSLFCMVCILHLFVFSSLEKKELRI